MYPSDYTWKRLEEACKKHAKLRGDKHLLDPSNKSPRATKEKHARLDWLGGADAAKDLLSRKPKLIKGNYRKDRNIEEWLKMKDVPPHIIELRKELLRNRKVWTIPDDFSNRENWLFALGNGLDMKGEGLAHHLHMPQIIETFAQWCCAKSKKWVFQAGKCCISARDTWKTKWADSESKKKKQQLEYIIVADAVEATLRDYNEDNEKWDVIHGEKLKPALAKRLCYLDMVDSELSLEDMHSNSFGLFSFLNVAGVHTFFFTSHSDRTFGDERL